MRRSFPRKIGIDQEREDRMKLGRERYFDLPAILSVSMSRDNTGEYLLLKPNNILFVLFLEFALLPEKIRDIGI